MVCVILKKQAFVKKNSMFVVLACLWSLYLIFFEQIILLKPSIQITIQFHINPQITVAYVSSFIQE